MFPFNLISLFYICDLNLTVQAAFYLAYTDGDLKARNLNFLVFSYNCLLLLSKHHHDQKFCMHIPMEPHGLLQSILNFRQEIFGRKHKIRQHTNKKCMVLGWWRIIPSMERNKCARHMCRAQSPWLLLFLGAQVQCTEI